jgi:hypothetical protein
MEVLRNGNVGALRGKFRRIFTPILVAFLASGSEATADKIGSSNLPPSAPVLKGRIVDKKTAASVVVVGTGAGITSNAGPTLSEQPSAFLDRAFGYATSRSTPLGQVDVSVNLSDRLYTAFDEAYEQSAAATLSLTKDWPGQQTLLSLAFSKDRDVEERLMQASLSVAHGGTEGMVKPYVKAETALLDYRDMPGDFYPFRNHDDRDRISSRAGLGLRLTLTDQVEIEVGAGVDTKHYLESYDDFGIRRDSVSIFPLIGLSYTGGLGSIRALYTPLWRTYREELFQSAWKHAYAIEGELRISDRIKAFATARHGFEETDFLIASSAYESVAMGGLTLTVGTGTVTLAASRTWRAYDDLDLAALFRADEKLEIAMYGEIPLIDTVSLNARISYLDYKSSFGGVGTDTMTASLGLTYAATHERGQTTSRLPP